jgi:hypothetical protein
MFVFATAIVVVAALAAGPAIGGVGGLVLGIIVFWIGASIASLFERR